MPPIIIIIIIVVVVVVSTPLTKLVAWPGATAFAVVKNLSTMIDCPGAYYALPENPDQIWATEWQGWDDFLGTCPTWAQARSLARQLHLSSSSSADAYFEWWKEVRPQAVNDGDPTSRLPFRPDLYYQKDDWQGWEDWLVGTSLAAADGALDATSHQ